PPVDGPVLREVVGPHVVSMRRTLAGHAVLRVSQATPLPLFPPHFQALLPPQPQHPLGVHPPALPTQERRDPPVAVARIALRQPVHVAHETLLLVVVPGPVALHAAVLPRHAAGPPLRRSEGLLQAPDAGPTPRRAQKFPLA